MLFRSRQHHADGLDRAGGTATGSRCRAAIAGVMCALPGLVNAVLANRVTGRQIHIMDRGWIDLKFAGTSFAGWFISWNTTVSDILDAGWHTPLPFYAIAFATSAVIVLGVARWVRNRNPSDATLPLAVAGALFGALIITMIMYDALAKFEPRMLYPAGVMVIASFAWTRVPIQQHTIRVMVAAAWVVIAASPTTWGTPRFDADPVRSQILTDAGARVVIGNAADLAHYQTGIQIGRAHV